ncbi:putative nucleoside-diphosphate-sugar epimerase [Mycena maculata]|uniref:Nucleoside-diphosphate-sugar epimerase n=1 Tax=Mycena maculata TaxID=230809 RepID=A0AAD7ISY0_9AGAR|nr:putative nucleoside-diphosphate-sugar epimerase [Mycena maculata]
MKIIIAGASGFVATELVRQSLSHPKLTSVVALARKPVAAPPNAGADASKLTSIVVKDYEHYPDDVKAAFAGADACIWTVAITPSKSASMPFDEVKRVCQDCTMAGLGAIHAAGPATPFRFLYVSGIAAERDQAKTPSFRPEYSLMRGETENKVLAFAAAHGIEAAAAKPGLITGPGVGNIVRNALAGAARLAGVVPSADVRLLSAAMLDQVLNGFETDEIMHADLIRIGEGVQAEQK